MRATQRRRPGKRELRAPPVAVDLDWLADRVRYVGSPEHKNEPSFAGPPRLRADASCCPREMTADLKRINEWLRQAIRAGAVGAPWEGRFPRYAWYKYGAIVLEGRLVNRETGEYKGYPLGREEWLAGIEELYAVPV